MDYFFFENNQNLECGYFLQTGTFFKTIEQNLKIQTIFFEIYNNYLKNNMF